MENWTILVHSGIAIVGTILLITKLKLHPVYALILAILYLGLVNGLGPTETLTTLTEGFGGILAEIGLLIAFGITMGTALAELGAIDRIVRALIRVFGAKRSPYALGVTAGTVMQPIFADVMLVVTSPIARGLARTIGPKGVPLVATSLVTGILTGLVMMIPSVGSLALAGVIDVPVWRYLIFGTLVGAATVVIVTLIMRTLILRTRFWNAELDEDQEGIELLDADAATSPLETEAIDTRRPPLWLALAPLVATLLLIAGGSIGGVLGVENEVLGLVTDPTFALFVGSGASLVLVAAYKREAGVKRALSRSFANLGEVLILTGLGGSLAGMVQGIGLGDLLAEFFQSSYGPPILVAWLIAVVLHIAIGSVSVAAITSAGILGPVAAASGVDPLLIALAAGAGSLFLMTVHSNFFWMAKNLLGQTTRGALKIVGLSTSLASVVGLGLVLLLSLFL